MRSCQHECFMTLEPPRHHDTLTQESPTWGTATLDLVDSVTVECVLKISSLSLHMKGAVFWGGFFFFGRMLSRCGQAVKKKTCYPRGEFILSCRFKAKIAKGREQSSSVCLGRLLTECLCLNFYPHLFLLLLLHRWQRRGFGRELLFHSPWKRRNEACVNFNHKS